MIRLNHPSDILAIKSVTNVIFNPAADHCLARVEDGVTLGGVIFQNFTGKSICIHMGGFTPHWVNKDMLWVAFHYPFVQLGVHKIIGQVCTNNEKSKEITAKLGFKEETRIRDVFFEGDMIIFSMYREDCRWLDLKPKTLVDNSLSLVAAE